ncbi:trans-2-enoyl-CoA reductase [Ereboglobus sp. PH5-5]|uniref:MDR family NADPH-dependent oxidoreductase n=1 Tax=unclassified Ereboglobus TaxID=2626932 RepID=UPI002406E362|nr:MULTISPECIES: 2-enoyl thioester reductase domain-containing protein [unclassified Ereboglobus]MDF9826263.1 trans-2-enoyl-CoA reductase [Ereboglobus sp. PH5-10]MDF9833851.1 trans-2-enoyl-CoA reductase [Ereboglobus sp. PH5-5]
MNTNHAIPAAPHAVRYHATGKPDEVLKYEAVSDDAREPAAGEVLVLMEAAVIHPSDLGMIGGTYGRLRALPAVAGREGVGRVAKLGADVTKFKIGDRVRMPEDSGVWREAIVARADDLMSVPSDLPAEQAAMAFINPPTAWLLLHEFVNLKPGDWIIQNASNSAVGECVIQFARSLGLRTACLVRSPEKHEANLRAMGADVVVADDDKALKAVMPQLGGAAPRLALNSIGGMSAITLTRSLGQDGQLVTFGGMTGDAIRFPTREFIFKNVALRGFWMDRWARSANPGALQAVLDAVYARLRDGSLKMAVDSVYPINQYAGALARAGGYGRNGKVLLRGPGA